jgi:hypothetical protein
MKTPLEFYLLRSFHDGIVVVFSMFVCRCSGACFAWSRLIERSALHDALQLILLLVRENWTTKKREKKRKKREKEKKKERWFFT